MTLLFLQSGKHLGSGWCQWGSGGRENYRGKEPDLGEREKERETHTHTQKKNDTNKKMTHKK